MKKFLLVACLALGLAGCSAPDQGMHNPESQRTAPPGVGKGWSFPVSPEEEETLLQAPGEDLLEPEPDDLDDFIDDVLVREVVASGWSSDYTHYEIRDERSRLVIFSKSEAPAELQRKVIAAAKEKKLAVEFDGGVLMSGEEYVAKIEAAYAVISPDRSKFGAIDHDSRYREVWVGVWTSVDAEKTIAALKRMLAPLVVHAEISDKPTLPGGSHLYASRWNDATAFRSGAAIKYVSNGSTYYCSSGFSARRKSNNSKVMITARHCSGQKFYVPESGVLYGTTATTSATSLDVRLLSAPSGAVYQSRTYHGDWKSSLKRERRAAATKAKVGNTIRASGAMSGSSGLSVVSVDQYDPDGYGPGFLANNLDGKYTVGPGDSGGPVYRYHADKTYTPLGIVHGPGFYKVGNRKEWYPQKACDQGAQGGRMCGKVSFHIDIKAIESTVYGP